MTLVLEWPDLVTVFQPIKESMHMMNALTRKLNRKTEIEENFIIKCTVVFQSLSCVLVTPWTAACQASLSFTLSRSCVKLMSIKWVMLLNHLILCRPLLLLHSNFLSIRVFSIELALHIRWPKDWSFSFSICPCSECSGLISLALTDLIPLLSKGLSSLFQAPQFENINFLVLRLLYGPTLTSIHDCWKNRSFDYSDLCQQSDVSVF